MHNEFILPSETEGFIHRMGDIIKRAESLMAKEQPVHSSGHRLPQPPFHSGVNSLSASQVSSSTCSFSSHPHHNTDRWGTKEVTVASVLLCCLIIINYIRYGASSRAYLGRTHKSVANGKLQSGEINTVLTVHNPS